MSASNANQNNAGSGISIQHRNTQPNGGPAMGTSQSHDSAVFKAAQRESAKVPGAA